MLNFGFSLGERIFMKTYIQLLYFARPLGRYLFPYLIFIILGQIFNVVNLTLLVPILDVLFGTLEEANYEYPTYSLDPKFFIQLFYYYMAQIINTQGKFGAIQYVCVTLISSVFLANVFRYLGVRITEYLRAQVIEKLRIQVFTKLLSLDLGYFSEKRKGDLMSRIMTDVQEVEHSVANSLFKLLKEPINLIILFIVLFAISTRLTIFTLAVIPALALTITWLSRKLRRFANLTQDSLGRTASILEEAISGLRIIKSFNAKPYIDSKFDQENTYYARLIRKMANTRELASPLSEFISVTAVAFILLYGGSLVLEENSGLTASLFFGYITVYSRVLTPAKGISTAISNIQRGLVSGERVLEIIRTQSHIQENPQAKSLSSFEKSIRFENVWFKYEKDWVLENISFNIEKGKSIALVGPSGSGKSTIADLIPRFYDVQKGQILIDDLPLANYQTDSLLDKMGIVTQESVLFHDTIFNNIAFANPKATMEEVIQAAKIANAHDFIMQTKQGYQTIIGDRGMKLSGGQRQRLAIARAVFKNPPILILDEATSALDTKAEKLVQDALNNLMKNRTSLIIAHRLSTIQNADEILVIDEGKIMERGNHKTLMANKNGIYNRLKLMQASG